MKYLRRFPEPLLEELVEGHWLPIVGAGLSRNAILPDGGKMPLWDDLGRSLAGGAGYSYVNALDAMSAYEHTFERRELIKRLARELRVADAMPGPAHKAFARLPFDRVVTTNLEFLLEQAYEAVGRRCEVVISEDQLPLRPRHGATVLVKLHGDVRHPGQLVATEDDYDGFLLRNPVLATHVSSLLIERAPVLIGYSLDDPDFRQLQTTLRDRLGDMLPTAYVITVGLGAAAAARYDRRGVKVIDLPGSAKRYGEILAEAFAEIEEYWGGKVLDRVRFTEEPPLEEVRSRPGGDETRLCFFSIPLRLLPFYKSEVFPLAERAGLVPVSGFDVEAGSGNLLAAIAALIGRSSHAVVDMGDGAGSTELGMALQEVDHENLLIVTSVSGPPLSIDQSLNFVVRSEPIDEDSESFFRGLEGWFQARSTSYDPGLNAQALLELGQWSAAVVAAVAELEITLQRFASDITDTSGSPVRRRGGPWQDLRNSELPIAPDLRHRLQEWVSLRNQIVHARSGAHQAEAAAAVGDIEELRRSLEG